MAGGPGRVAATILAGGRAERLGGAVKPLLVVGAGAPGSDGRRILDRQLDVLLPLFPAVALVVADARARDEFRALALVGRPGVDVICDRLGAGAVAGGGPGLGPLAGLDAALAWLPAGFDSVVCVAGDMPSLSVPLLRHLRDVSAQAWAVVPRWSRGLEPLCARYARAAAPRVARALASGTRALHRFVEEAAAMEDVVFVDEPALRDLDPALETFTNLNTPADVQRLRGG